MTRLARRPILATRPSRPGVERKSARELDLMRQAGRINGLALAAMRAAARPGVTTRQLDAIAERVIVANKGVPAFKGYAGPYPYPNTVTVSVNDELVHGIPGPRVLREGDVASLDCGTVYQGYYADSAITVGIGQDFGTGPAFVAGDRAVAGRRHRVHAAGQAHRRCGGGHAGIRGISRLVHGAQLHQPWHRPAHARRPGSALLRQAGHRAAAPAGDHHCAGADGAGGTAETRVLEDQWTVVSADGSLTAHFEHTVAVTEGEPEILTQMGPSALDE